VAVGPEPWTWNAIFDKLLQELASKLLNNQQEAYFDTVERHIRLHLRPRIGKQVAHETTPADLERLWLDLLDMQLAPKYVTTIRGTLSLATSAAHGWEVLDRNVVALSPVPGRAGEVGRRKRTQIIPFTPQEAARIRCWLVDNWQTRSQNALVLLCSLETGARRAETLGLRWSGVDFERGTLSYVEQVKRLKGGTLVLRPLKTIESERTISVSPLLLKQLQIHRAAVGGIGDQLVFCHNDGRMRNPDKVNDFVSRHLPWEKDIGLSRRPQPHLLRHTHASLLIYAGESIPSVADRLGHSISTTTLAIYAHAVKAERDKTASVWDRMMEESGAVDLGTRSEANARAGVGLPTGSVRVDPFHHDDEGVGLSSRCDPPSRPIPR
jgi:integrase